MSEKSFNTRQQQKIDTSANWNLVPNFVPKKGEMVFYSDMDNYKIGDGTTTISELPFALGLSIVNGCLCCTYEE